MPASGRLPKRLLGAVAIAASTALLSACGGDDNTASTPANVPSTAVAVVGSAPIAQDRFDRALRARTRGISPLSGAAPSTQIPLDSPRFRRCAKALQTSIAASAKLVPADQRPATSSRAQLVANCAAQYAQARTATMSSLIQEQWLVQQAAATKAALAGKDVDATYAQYVAAAGLRPGGKPLGPKAARRAFAKLLRRSGLTEQDVRAQLSAVMLQQQLSQSAAKQDASPTTAELKRFYTDNPGLFGKAGTRTIDVVTTNAKNKAELAQAALAKGEDVQTVIRTYATGGVTQNTQQGRVTITQGAGQLPPAVERAVFATKKGKTGTVRAGDTYAAFAVRKTHDAKLPPFAKVRDQVTQQYATQRAQRAQITFQNELQKTWRPQTLCRKGYIVPQCSNGPELPAQALPGETPKD